MEEAVDGSTIKQSSISGSVLPRVKVLLGSMLGNEAVWVEVGIPPSSTGRKDDVQRETWVPSIVFAPERLKYLQFSSAQ